MSTDRTSALPPGVDGVEIKVTLAAEMVERGRQAFRIGLARAERRIIWFVERPLRQGDSVELPLLAKPRRHHPVSAAGRRGRRRDPEAPRPRGLHRSRPMA
jgi:hypothetical protein